MTIGLAPVPVAVLIADDEAVICNCLAALLRERRCTVYTAADGQEAVEVYRAHRGEIDVLFLDVHLPRLDGLAALEAVRAINPGARCCLMTTREGPVRNRLKPGLTELLAKPFDLVDVLNVLARLRPEQPGNGEAHP